MAKLRCTHNCSTGAKVSYSHHTLFTQASFHGTKVAHVAPRSPRCSGTFQLVSFFFKCANVPSANCFCPKQKMYFFKLENVKKKRWPRCVGRFPVGLFTPNVQLPSTPASEFKHWRPGTPLLRCSYTPFAHQSSKTGQSAPLFSLVLLDFWAFLSFRPDAWKELLSDQWDQQISLGFLVWPRWCPLIWSAHSMSQRRSKRHFSGLSSTTLRSNSLAWVKKPKRTWNLTSGQLEPSSLLTWSSAILL